MIDIVRSESYLYTKTFSKIRNLMEIKRICKRTLFIIALLCCNLSIFAQRTFSYSQTSSFCPQTGTSSPTMMAYVVTIGDGYVEIGGNRFNRYQKNLDGSTTYLPARGNTSVGFYQVNAILLSSNWQVLEERVTSSVGGIGLNIINTFQMVEEDGGQYAMAQNSAAIESQRGGSYSSPSSRSETRSTCSKCHGTGVDPNYLKYWGGRQSWLGYYNKSGNKCPHCGNYAEHYHSRCSDCNVPSY